MCRCTTETPHTGRRTHSETDFFVCVHVLANVAVCVRVYVYMREWRLGKGVGHASCKKRTGKEAWVTSCHARVPTQDLAPPSSSCAPTVVAASTSSGKGGCVHNAPPVFVPLLYRTETIAAHSRHITHTPIQSTLPCMNVLARKRM